MQSNSLITQALGRAAATTVYVALIVSFMSNAEKWFGEQDDFLVPVFMLLLFVISATVTSFLVLGKPIMLYLNGAKKEAFTFLFATVGWLAAFLVVVGIVMAVR